MEAQISSAPQLVVSDTLSSIQGTGFNDLRPPVYPNSFAKSSALRWMYHFNICNVLWPVIVAFYSRDIMVHLVISFTQDFSDC